MKIPRDLIRHLEWSPSQEIPPTIKPSSTSDVGAIVSENDFWRIPNVNFRRGIHTFDLKKGLLSEGEEHEQAVWASRYNDAQGKDMFYTPDYPLFYGILSALYSKKDDPSQAEEVAAARTFLKDVSRKNWLMTLTRVVYETAGKDKVLHSYGTPDEYGLQVDFVDKDEWIDESTNPLPYQALLDTKDSTQEISNVFRWLNDTRSYIWRLNSRPQKYEERVARFVADSDRADLYCIGDPSYRGASLGVRARAEGTASR